MWSTVLLVNSILLTLFSTYLVYSVGAAILLGHWKAFVLTLLTCIFLGFAQVALGAMAEP
jgi:hypothetical protein